MKKLFVIAAVDAVLWAGLWILWANAVVGCAHVVSRPMTGAIGRACKLPVVIVCGAALPDRDCEQVHLACDYVNAAFGAELLHWTANDRGDVEVTQGDLQPVDPFAESQPGMVTGYQVYRGSGCFGPRQVRTAVSAECCSEGTRQTQFRHELLHVLGLTHNEWDPESVMAPGTVSNLPDARPLSASDLAALHAMYERTFGF